MNKQPLADRQDQQTLEGKPFAILAYISILCIIPLVLKKNHPFVLSHARQGLVIFIAEVAIFILHIILGQWLLRLGMFICGVFSFVGMIAVLKGQVIKLPFISDIAENISL